MKISGVDRLGPLRKRQWYPAFLNCAGIYALRRRLAVVLRLRAHLHLLLRQPGRSGRNIVIQQETRTAIPSAREPARSCATTLAIRMATGSRKAIGSPIATTQGICSAGSGSNERRSCPCPVYHGAEQMADFRVPTAASSMDIVPTARQHDFWNEMRATIACLVTIGFLAASIAPASAADGWSLASVNGRWSSSDCQLKYYDYRVEGREVSFREQSGAVDVERITEMRSDGFSAVTVSSSSSSQIGTRWTYTFDGNQVTELKILILADDLCRPGAGHRARPQQPEQLPPTKRQPTGLLHHRQL